METRNVVAGSVPLFLVTLKCSSQVSAVKPVELPLSLPPLPCPDIRLSHPSHRPAHLIRDTTESHLQSTGRRQCPLSKFVTNHILSLNHTHTTSIILFTIKLTNCTQQHTP